MNKYIITSVFIIASVFIITVVAEGITIPRLRASAAQPIYTDGPSWHKSKSGTPTMGGLAFVFSSAVVLIASCVFLLSRQNAPASLSILITLGFSLLNALIGMLDDLTKLRHKENAGLTPRQKLILQFFSALIFLSTRAALFDSGTDLTFSFGTLSFGIFYYPLAIILLLGIINCANLTDGIDGLASSVAFTASLGLILLMHSGHIDLLFICSAVAGAALGFLVFNSHPAKIFMGDTGSLFLGAMLAGAVFSTENPTVIIPVGAVYVIEGVSVILQVIFFKLTGRRIFKMAPLHHHLEKCGISENRICVIAISVTLIFCALSTLLY